MLGCPSDFCIRDRLALPPVNPAISSLSMPLLLKALAAIKPAAIGAICVDLAAW
jgi:hypothetical protein